MWESVNNFDQIKTIIYSMKLNILQSDSFKRVTFNCRLWNSKDFQKISSISEKSKSAKIISVKWAGHRLYLLQYATCIKKGKSLATGGRIYKLLNCRWIYVVVISAAPSNILSCVYTLAYRDKREKSKKEIQCSVVPLPFNTQLTRNVIVTFARGSKLVTLEPTILQTFS